MSGVTSAPPAGAPEPGLPPPEEAPVSHDDSGVSAEQTRLYAEVDALGAPSEAGDDAAENLRKLESTLPRIAEVGGGIMADKG